MERAERVLQRVPGIGSSCLYRSLGRFGVLSAWGYLPTFFMGVSAANPEQGHAWVELGGVAFREAQLGDYVVSFRFPPAPVERC